MLDAPQLLPLSPTKLLSGKNVISHLCFNVNKLPSVPFILFIHLFRKRLGTCHVPHLGREPGTDFSFHLHNAFYKIANIPIWSWPRLSLRKVKEGSQSHTAEPGFTCSCRKHWLNFGCLSGEVLETQQCRNWTPILRL